MAPIANLEDELQAALPEWIEQDPARWQQLQYALRQASHQGPVFPTFEEFIHWVDEDTSAEWDHGEVVFMSPASARHQLLVGFLHTLLQIFSESRQPGIVLTAPFKMKLEYYGPEPDLMFLADENRERLQDGYLDGPADLVVEIVSPESVSRDRGRKFVAYEKAGIPEYWLIDPEREVAEFYTLDERGRYMLHTAPSDGRYQSRVLDGFGLDPRWLWQTPLPPVLDILREMNLI